MHIVWYLFLGLAAGLLLWMGIESRMLRVTYSTISQEGLPHAFQGVQILQISDLHHKRMGKANCRIARKAEKLHPDLIVISGDLVSRNMRDFSETAVFLRRLRKTAPVFYVPGNHELDMPDRVRRTLYATLRRCGVRVLLNETEVLRRGRESIRVAGASLRKNLYRDENRSFRNRVPYTTEELTQALGKKQGFTVLLAHNPLIADVYAEWGADITLTGHVHGGILRLPGIGGVLSPERTFFPKYSKGKYSVNGKTLYVSGGVGKLRLFNPPEINLLTLR